MSVVVFGSINMDLVVRTPRLPQPGETLIGREFFTAPGGKGANQAVAASRLGVPTKMVGRVGSDVFADALLAGLRTDNVDIQGVTIDTRSSGIAVIAVDDDAENNIIVVPGANGAVAHDDLSRLETALIDARVLLLQPEVPLDTVIAAAQLAREKGVTVILDPAPARALPPELYKAIDMITPNETEAALLVGFPLTDDNAVWRATEVLHTAGVPTVIIKRGDKGAYVSDGGRPTHYKAQSVTAVDTVAAGDAFNGALAAALDEGLPLHQAITWARAAGALSVTRSGAQPSLPTRTELMAMLEQA